MGGHEALERFAAVVLVTSGLLLVPAGWWARRNAVQGRASNFSDLPTVRATFTVAAAALSLGAGVIHLAAAPEHFIEYAPFGAAFLVAGLLQALVAACFLRFGTRSLALPVIIANGALIAIWIWSRTTGLPIGPEPWHAEAIGVADVIATVLEAALIATILVANALTKAGERARGRLRDAASLLVYPVVGSIGIATLVAVAALGIPTADHEPGDHAAAMTGAANDLHSESLLDGH